MNSKQINLKQIIPTVLICGLSGGGLLILSTIVSTKGWWSIIIYAMLMFATVLALKVKKQIEITYLKAFLTVVLTFMLMSYILYFYIVAFVNPDNGIPLMGHAWRFFAVLGLGIVTSAIMGLFFLITNKGKANTQTS